MRTQVDEIKQRLPMLQVAEYYGFSPDRSGFIKCPFHQGDHTASLKIYAGAGGWHCFGCHRGGSVIDFVMQLFDLNFQQATLRLNADFGLGLSVERPSKAAYSKAMEERRREQNAKEQKEAEWRAVIKELWHCREAIDLFPPTMDGGNIIYPPQYVDAVKRLPYLEYWLDDYIEKGGADCWPKSPNLQSATI